MPDEQSPSQGPAPDVAQAQDFLATLPAAPAERKLAAGVALASMLFLVAMLPFAKRPQGELWAFIPIYESILVINDLITALLLYGQYGFVRSRALLVLAGAYLFTAMMAALHAMSFPGLFATGGLIGGAQTTVWLYILWHAGFPLLVAAYALMAPPQMAQDLARSWNVSGRAEARRAVTIATAIVGVAVAALALLVTVGHDLLPQMLVARRYTVAMIAVTGAVWVLSFVALLLLWWRRSGTVLDLWLMVVMCAWIADVALSALFNATRFDLGFYAGRIFGLLANSFVLMVLLIDHGRLYARLVRAHESERRALQRELEKATALRAANQELDAFSYSVSHDLRAPLRTVDGYARMLQEDFGEKLGAEGNRMLGVVRDGSMKMTHLIDDLLEFSRLGRAPIVTRPIDLEALARQVIEEVRGDCKGREIDFQVGALGLADVDPNLLRHALANLISNAVKYSRNNPHARIEVGRQEGARPEEPAVYYVKDNGAGFDMRYSSKLFGVFQRLHGDHEYEGTGVGLAIVQRVISRHGGRVWAEGHLGEGAEFYFTLAADPLANTPAPISSRDAAPAADSGAKPNEGRAEKRDNSIRH